MATTFQTLSTNLEPSGLFAFGVAAGNTLRRYRDRIVRMQTLVMRGADVEIADARIGVERAANASRGVFAEHEILSIGECERLLVFALDRGLHGRLQRPFHGIDPRVDCEQRTVGESQTYVGRAALAMRRGDDAVAAAEPREDFCSAEHRSCRKIRRETFLDELARQLKLAYHAWDGPVTHYPTSAACLQTAEGCAQRRLHVATLAVDAKGLLSVADPGTDVVPAPSG